MSNSPPPLISIIVPIYKVEPYIHKNILENQLDFLSSIYHRSQKKMAEERLFERLDVGGLAKGKKSCQL